jgi:hypothetical protein
MQAIRFQLGENFSKSTQHHHGGKRKELREREREREKERLVMSMKLVQN